MYISTLAQHILHRHIMRRWRNGNIMNTFVNEAWIKLQLHFKHFER